MDEPIETLQRQLPDTPAGRQLGWWLRMIATRGEGAGAGDKARFAPALHEPLSALFDPDRLQEAWADHAGRIGEPAELELEPAGEHEAVARLLCGNGRKWTLTVAVEPGPPHLISIFRYERRNDFQLEVREATAADALTLADIERRCPIVMGDTAVWFDRGASYFDFTRLMEDFTIGLASVDGVPAAVSCGAVHPVRIGGEPKQLLTVSHLRVLPEHQRKGLWGAANSALDKYWPRVDGSRAFISVDNIAMQHGFAHSPDKWPQVVQRVELDCAALAGPAAGRPATPADTAELARRLNAFHDAEEMFAPYTEASLEARLTRAPDLYGWDRLWMTDGALAGIWPAGEAMRSVAETRGERAVATPGIVLDYAFAPGAEAELEALLRAWCGWLARRGLDTLVIYTSPASAGGERLRRLARAAGEFFTWTPGVSVPPGAATRGLYVDAVYF